MPDYWYDIQDCFQFGLAAISPLPPSLVETLWQSFTQGFQSSNSDDHAQSATEESHAQPQDEGGNIDSTAQVLMDAAQDVLVGIRWLASQSQFAAALAVADQENMDDLDPYELQLRALDRARPPRNSSIELDTQVTVSRGSDDTAAVEDQEATEADPTQVDATKTTPLIRPVIDGRLKDIAVTK